MSMLCAACCTRDSSSTKLLSFLCYVFLQSVILTAVLVSMDGDVGAFASLYEYVLVEKAVFHMISQDILGIRLVQ